MYLVGVENRRFERPDQPGRQLKRLSVRLRCRTSEREQDGRVQSVVAEILSAEGEASDHL